MRIQIRGVVEYYTWKDGESILTTAELKKALGYAFVYELIEVEWLQKEVSKRNVSRIVKFY